MESIRVFFFLAQFGVHHKKLVTWENQPEGLTGIVPWGCRVSPIFKGCFRWLWQTTQFDDSTWAATKTSMKRLYKGVDLGYFGESKNPVKTTAPKWSLGFEHCCSHVFFPDGWVLKNPPTSNSHEPKRHPSTHTSWGFFVWLDPKKRTDPNPGKTSGGMTGC